MNQRITSKAIATLHKELLINPIKGYKKMTSFKNGLPPVYRKDLFWQNWDDDKQIPHPDIRLKLQYLHAFHESKYNFTKLFDEQKRLVKQISLSKRVELFFQTYQHEFKSWDYNQGFVERITFLTEAIHELIYLDENGESDVSGSLDFRAPYFYYNTKVFEEIADAYVHGGFELFQNGNDSVIAPINDRLRDTRLKELIKSHCLSNSYANKHEGDVSDMEHFKRVDPMLNTEKGLLTLIVSNGHIVNTSEGTFGLEVEEIDKVNVCELINKQQISYLYRKEIESCFEPKFVTYLKEVVIEGNDYSVSLYDLVVLLAAIKAIITVFSPYLNELNCVKLDAVILHENLRYFDELRDLSIEKVEKLLVYLIKQKTPGIAIIDTDIYFSVPVFSYFPVSKYLFDRHISEVFYKQNSKDGSAQAEHSQRENSVVVKLKSFFSEKYFISLSNIRLKEEGYEEDGEIDLIIVSLKEKTIFVIEVKLENTVSYRWINKARWCDLHINKAKEQHAKDERFINSSKGKEFFRCKGVEIDGSWSVEHFLVSDNMLCDHLTYVFNPDTRKRFLKISIFELECLLNKAEVFKPQTKDWIAYHYNHIEQYSNELKIPQGLLEYLNDENDKSQNALFVSFIEENRILKHQKIHSLLQLSRLISDEVVWKLPQKYVDKFTYELKTEASEPTFAIKI